MQIHEIMDAVGGKIFHIYCQQYHRSRWLYVIFQDFYSGLKLVNDDINALCFVYFRVILFCVSSFKWLL